MAQVHLSSGVFWFWDGPWWTHLEQLCPPSVTGIQILCEPLGDSVPLPPIDVARRLSERFELTLHPTFAPGPLPQMNLAELYRWIEATGVRDVIVHIDHLPGGAEPLRRQLPAGTRLLIENIGRVAGGGTMPDEMHELLAADPQLGFVFDVAHWFEVGDAAPLEPWLDDPLVMSRLVKLHVSTSGIQDDAARASCEVATACHLPAVANPLYPDAGAKQALSRFPLIAEGCLPPGVDGERWLRREVDYLLGWGGACRES